MGGAAPKARAWGQGIWGGLIGWIVLFSLGSSSAEGGGRPGAKEQALRSFGWTSPQELQELLNVSCKPVDRRKMSENLCGPVACYLAIETLLNLDCPFVDVVRACNVRDSDHFSNMLDLRKACEAYGLKTRAIYVEDRRLLPEMLPAIVHFVKPYQHFEFLAIRKRDGALFSSSLQGTELVSWEEVQGRSSGYVLSVWKPGTESPPWTKTRPGMLSIILSPFVLWFLFRSGRALYLRLSRGSKGGSFEVA